MATALDRRMTGLATWTQPVGGMFFWLELTHGLDAMALLPRAVEAGVAYVPGAPFYAQAPRVDALRLSFITVAPARIEAGVAALAGAARDRGRHALMLVGVISDTHGLLRPEALDAIRDCAIIVHAGDVGSPDRGVSVCP
jgi:hypothetical protein